MQCINAMHDVTSLHLNDTTKIPAFLTGISKLLAIYTIYRDQRVVHHNYRTSRPRQQKEKFSDLYVVVVNSILLHNDEQTSVPPYRSRVWLPMSSHKTAKKIVQYVTSRK